MSFNINNISYDDFNDICRMCMLNCDVKFYQNCIISDIFHKLTDLHFETDDDLPKQICRNCFEKINEIHEFVLKCEQTHNALMECLNKKQNVVQSIETPLILDVNDDIFPETSEIDDIDLQETSYNIEEEITIEEHKIELIKVEHVSDETSEININCSEDDLLSSNNQSSEVKSKEDTVYKCDVCCKTFIYFNVFKQHKSLPDCKRPFKCEQCLKSFTKSNHLERHKLSHSGERPFKCDLCSKSFSESSKMKRHMLTHSEERSFKCDQCSKSFIQLVHLQNHVILHTGERPFKCDQCSKSYTHSSNLYKHRRTHTDERPFKCDQCLQSFNDSCTLYKHRRTHTGERPFKCDQCFKSFNHLGNMKRHMRMHSGERPSKQS